MPSINEMRDALKNAGKPVAANAPDSVVEFAYSQAFAPAKKFADSVVEASARAAKAQRSGGLAPWQGEIPKDTYTLEPFLGKVKPGRVPSSDFDAIAEACGLAQTGAPVHVQIMDGTNIVAKTTWESITSVLGDDPNQFLDGQSFVLSAVAVTGNDRREIILG